MVLAVLLLIILPNLNKVSARNSDLSIKINSESSCIAGFPCYVNVTVKSLDGSILVNYVKLVTPWGAFIRNLGFRELSANSTIQVSIPVNVSRNSLEGPNFIIPFIEYFKRGEIGLKTVEGNRTSLFVIKPKVNATMYITLNKRELYTGEILRINGSYEIKGIPQNYKPSLLIYLNNKLQLRKKLNGTLGDFHAFLSSKREGNFTLNVSLCYGIDCISREYSIAIKRIVKIVSEFNRSALSDSLKGVNEMEDNLEKLYKNAVSDSIKLPEDILINMSIISSKIRDAELILKKENISYSDILEIQKLLNQSESMIIEVSKEIVESYKRSMYERISKLEDELSGISSIINKTRFGAIKEELNNLSDRVNKANSTNAPSIYSNITKELNDLSSEIMSLREKAMQEAKLLSAIVSLVIFVAMISGAIIILREWKSKLNRE